MSHGEITPLHVMSAFETEPSQLDFVIPGFLAGTVGCLYAPGGAGKSFLALEIAMSVAGVDFLGLGTHRTGRTLYLALEDPDVILRRRLHAIGSHLSLAQRESVAERLEILPLVGVFFDLLSGTTASWLQRRAEDVRLVIVDTLSRAQSGDESNNGEMAKLLRALEHIGASTGAAVLFLHHVNKSSGRERNGDQFSVRGASALLDNARFGAAITYIDDDTDGRRIRYSVSKHNYAAPIVPLHFLRHEGGVLLPAPPPQEQDAVQSDKPKAPSIRRANPFGSPYLAAKNGEIHDW
ncbi:hypothetical protein BBC27_11285 [Acidithiobacillus ferrivorans]|uniref:Replication protein A n=1 Tax=Acidithiobacillus ferrivorans TaxID=160808 RepID=A0A1B9BYM5_9PROT|nr:helicase RepA family protein [Acidithiobacillus ferrivorans]OCB02798.1 hypothetical protein BBC27_11285 [Acidithiobacillus ferrivorans]